MLFLLCVFCFALLCFFLFLFKRIRIFTINSPKGALVQVSHTKELYMLRTCVFSAILFSLHSYMVNCLGKIMMEYTFVKLLMPMTFQAYWG